MKIVAAVALLGATLGSFTLAMAEDPVPFHALMQKEGAPPAIPVRANSNDQATAPSNPPAHKTHTTRAGKIMTGVGIGMVAIGGGVMALIPHAFATPTDKAELYGASGATMGVGVVLIVTGVTRRSAQ